MDEPLELLEDILGVSTILARAKLRAHPQLRALGVQVRGSLRFRRDEVLRVMGRGNLDQKRSTERHCQATSGKKSRRHPLVIPVEHALANHVYDDLKHRVKLRKASSSGFEVVVGDKMCSRAVAFLDAFVRHADAEGGLFAPGSTNGRSSTSSSWTRMLVDGESFTFKLGLIRFCGHQTRGRYGVQNGAVAEAEACA